MNRWFGLCVVACVGTYVALCSQANAYTLWTENAENGLANVIDNTDASYDLIQSEVVGEGDSAFHLAHPVGQDNWFTINQSLSIQSDTKLFFLSRLRSATPTQIARVQLSTDNGGSWPANIFNQAGSGSGTGGEGAFTLKEVDLGSYANQNLRLRFYYDRDGGSYFPQTSSAVGWFVDNIQIGSEFQKLQWSIGNPSPHAQLYLEYINRARADALAEAARLANEPDSNVQNAYNFFGIQGQNIVNQFNWYVDNGLIDRFAQPLSFQSQLLMAAELHTQDLFQNQFQGHTSSNNPPAPFQPGYTFSQRLDAVGYDGGAGENVYSSADSVAHGHAGFDVDWGNVNSPGSTGYNPAFVGQGMQNPAGHRRNLHNGGFKEIGIGVINGPDGAFGPQYVTQDLGNPGDVRYITGVVYQDVNSNSFYDIDEGRSGVRIDVVGSPFYALSSTSGGYSVPVPQDGMYAVTFSGGGFATHVANATIVNGENEKVDYLAILNLIGDYNHNNLVDAADYTVWRNSLGQSGAGLAADGNGDTHIDNVDYNLWKTHFGEALDSGSAGNDFLAVPEPDSRLLVIWGLIFLSVGYDFCRVQRVRHL